MPKRKAEPSTRLASEHSEAGSYSQSVGNDRSYDLGSPGNGVTDKPVGRGVTTRTVPNTRVAKPTADVAIATQAPIASLVDPGANCTVVDGQATSLMDGSAVTYVERGSQLVTEATSQLDEGEEPAYVDFWQLLLAVGYEVW